MAVMRFARQVAMTWGRQWWKRGLLGGKREEGKRRHSHNPEILFPTQV